MIFPLVFHKRAPSTIGGLTSLHNIADEHIPGIKKHYVAQMVRLQSKVPRARIAQLIQDGQPTISIIQEIPWEIVFGKPGLGAKAPSPRISLKEFFTQEFTTILTAAGVQVNAEMAEVIPALPSLSGQAMDAAAAAWAAQNSARLITGVSAATQNAVRATLVSGILTNRTPQQIATDITQIIGLRAPQASKLLAFGETLAGQGVPLGDISRRLASVKSGMLSSRATTIARTETINAANGGQQLAWQAAKSEGIITDENARKVWIVTPDDLLDLVICAPMPDMEENQDVKMDEVFTTGIGGTVLHPTAHPNCRCAQGLLIIDS